MSALAATSPSASGASLPWSRELIGFALGVGVAADLLLRGVPWGINLPLWSGLGLAVLHAFLRRHERRLPGMTWVWLATAWLCTALAAVRGAPELMLVTLGFGLTSLLVAAWTAHGGSLRNALATNLAANAIVHAILTGVGLLAWFPRGGDAGSGSESVPDRPRSPVARSVVGGLASVPVLVLFSALFSSADPVFAHGLKRAFDFDLERLLGHAAVIFAATWLVSGFVRRLVLGVDSPTTYAMAPNPPERSPDVEILAGLGLLTGLFVAFVGIQIRYLAGSETLVQETIGLTYAEYARHGFFELLAATGLVLPILLASDWALARSTRRAAFRKLGGALLLLVGLVAASAARRLHLYTEAYGLTALRLYAVTALLWIVLIAIWLGVTVLPGRRERFVGGAWILAAVTLFGLHALDPDAFIARHNVGRARAGRSFDLEHALRLGPDAVPVLVANLDVVPDAERARFLERLRERQQRRMPPPDWRTWNFARARANIALAVSRP